MKNLSNSGSTLYNWVNRLHNSTTCSNLVRKSHYILPRQIERQLLKTEEITPLYMNLLFSTISSETELGYLLKNAADPNSMFLTHHYNRPLSSIFLFTDGSKDEVFRSVGAALLTGPKYLLTVGLT